MRKEELVKQIATDLYLKEIVVEEVLDRFVDIAVEEIVNTGEFRLHRFFNVSSVAYRAYEGGKGTVPAHTRLKIKLSEGIHRLFKHRAAHGVTVDRNNWRDLIQELSRGAHGPQTGTKAKEVQEFYNPLLEDD